MATSHDGKSPANSTSLGTGLLSCTSSLYIWLTSEPLECRLQVRCWQGCRALFPRLLARRVRRLALSLRLPVWAWLLMQLWHLSQPHSCRLQMLQPSHHRSSCPPCNCCHIASLGTHSRCRADECHIGFGQSCCPRAAAAQRCCKPAPLWRCQHARVPQQMPQRQHGKFPPSQCPHQLPSQAQ